MLLNGMNSMISSGTFVRSLLGLVFLITTVEISIAAPHFVEVLQLSPGLAKYCARLHEEDKKYADSVKKRARLQEQWNTCVVLNEDSCEVFKQESQKEEYLSIHQDMLVSVLGHIPAGIHDTNDLNDLSNQLLFYLGSIRRIEHGGWNREYKVFSRHFSYMNEEHHNKKTTPIFENLVTKFPIAFSEFGDDKKVLKKRILDNSGYRDVADNDDMFLKLYDNPKTVLTFKARIDGKSKDVCSLAASNDGLLATVAQSYKLDGPRHDPLNVSIELRLDDLSLIHISEPTRPY